MSEENESPRPQLSSAALNYRPRIVGYGLFALMLASVSDERLGLRYGLIAFCLVWPHLGYWLAKRRGGDLRAETTNIYIDCVFGGAVMVAYAFRLWPTTATYTIGIINGLLFRGLGFLLPGLLLSGVGIVGAWALVGVEPHLETEPLGIGVSLVAIFAYVVMIGSLSYRMRIRQREMRDTLRREERQSHQLLLNVFPAAVIPRLKRGEAPIADQFADVSVLFADIVDFTPLAERLGPKRTVLLLNELFARFDQAAARVGVEKIETTGDGYLAVGGAPGPLDHHPRAVADFALALLDATRQTSVGDAEQVHIRVGIHTGPVFAGVIGESRFHYKIFGETVNIASRIQGQAQPGRILVSETTYKRIQATHTLEERGTADLKGHGPMRTYWLTAPTRLS